jgi:hypothetical protein
MSRRIRIALIVLAALAFLLVSAELGRWLQLENVERDDVLALLQSQASGSTTAMLGKLHACDAACRAAVASDASGERGGGAVKILAYQSATGYALSSASGETRVAWKLPGRLPVVQCVLVRRTGNAVTGLSISLLKIGTPISGTADCT